jgi:hypothetical protein
VQQPSSLVFVAIVLGWAAYLLPQWVRRRETLGQNPGHDRHSSRLRVLHRRQPLPPASAGPSSTPILPDPRTAGEPVVDVLAASAPAPIVLPQLVTGPGPAAAAARRRARVLSTLVVLTVLSWLLSLVVPVAASAGWAFTLLLGLDLAALVVAGRRRAVLRARRHREQRRRLEEARRRRAARPARVAAEPPVAAAPAETPVPEVPARPERASERVARELDEGVSAAVWTPVPVPPPTYTLKPAVPRPEPAPLDLPGAPPPTPTEPAATVDAPAPAAERTFADELDLDEVLARRRAVNG